MKSILFLFCILSVFSCLESHENTSETNYAQTSESDFVVKSDIETGEAERENKNQKPTTKLYKIRSIKYNMLFGVMPIPMSWKVVNNTKENILFKGPSNLKVYGDVFASFSYSQNPQSNYFYEQSGAKVQAPKSIEQVISQDIKPYLESQGWSFLKQFELKELAEKDTHFDKALFKSVPEQKSYRCVVTEWKDKTGKKSLGIIRYFTNYYSVMPSMDWGYTINALEINESSYEMVKQQYISALLNMSINPNWIQRNNQYYAQKSQQSRMNHQQRMSSLQSQGQSIANTGNTYSSIIDSNHESWKKRNEITDAGHSNTINSGIWERTAMQDQSGNQYQIEGHYDQVWKGQDVNNSYIGTTNSNWNPNVDMATNNIDWEKLEKSDDNY